MRRERLFLGLLILLLAALLTFGYRGGMYVERLLTGPLPIDMGGGTIRTLTASVEGYGTIHTLQGDATLPGQVVPVYSRYPFNLKNEILVAAGAGSGIKAGDAAFFQGSILGTVEKVFAGSALIQTIFDARFKAPVRIGAEGVDALLVGGPEPQLTLIPADAKVQANDQVYSSGQDLPYGSELGTIGYLADSPNTLFKEGGLKVFYNPAEMNEVTIVPQAATTTGAR